MVRNRLLLATAISFIALASMLVWMTWMPGESYRGPLRLTADDEAVAARLRLHVAALATSPRSLWADGLDRSVEYLSGQIREMGYEPVLHTYEVSGTPVSNVEVELRGNALPEEIVIVGAHYDSVDESPGADDNASGVAVVLELLRAAKPSSRTQRYVFFVNEEPPYVQENVVAMISVESVGYFSERGDFIAFVGDLGSRDLVHDTIESFRVCRVLPSEGLTAPLLSPGYPAVMVTDTALFRNPHYHTGTDRSETLDYARMALVVNGLYIAIFSLACGSICPI